jgi:translation initiation factor 3 subunit A
MHMQVAQLEKETKELNKRPRIIVKRVDHIDRAYRKEERPLLAQDYDQQQTTDRQTFAAIQTVRKEAARVVHKAHLETKKYDYEARRAVVLAKKGKYAKKNDAASGKIEEERAKWKEEGRIKEERIEAGKFSVFTFFIFFLPRPLPERHAEEDRSRPTVRYPRGSGSR